MTSERPSEPNLSQCADGPIRRNGNNKGGGGARLLLRRRVHNTVIPNPSENKSWTGIKRARWVDKVKILKVISFLKLQDLERVTSNGAPATSSLPKAPGSSST